MIHTVDEQLLEEIARFRLAHTCERCAQFEEVSGACSLGFPNEVHRERPLVIGAELVFCKNYELG